MPRIRNGADKFPTKDVREALGRVGVEVSLVEKWLDSCVGCKRRKKSVAVLIEWSSRVNAGEIDSASALNELETLIKE